MSMDMFEQALAAEGISGKLADVARSIYMQESGQGKNTKTSNRGAAGGMQIIPSTFASVADKGWDINDPLQNARAGIRYLSQMHTKAGGDPTLTAVGYYGGPGGIDKARNGVAVKDPKNPNAPDTFQYAQQVVARIPNSKQAAPAVVAEAPAQTQNLPTPTPTTVQLAHLAQGRPVNVPLGYVAPKEDWKEFQQAQPDPITAKSLDFGGAPKKFDPLQYAQNNEVNFRSFLGKRGRG